MRNDYGRGNSITACRKTNRLPMIAACCAHYPSRFFGSAKVVEVDEPSANLERTRRRVILVLHPHCSAYTRFEQRPPILRSWRHGLVYESSSVFQRSERRLTEFNGACHPDKVGDYLRSSKPLLVFRAFD